MTAFNYTRGDYVPVGDYSLLPDGEYQVEITDCNLGDNKQGTGKILKITYTILDGEYSRRKIFDNLNIINESQQAQAIANNALNGILKAIDIAKMTDTANLLRKELCIKIHNYKNKRNEDTQSFKYQKSMFANTNTNKTGSNESYGLPDDTYTDPFA